MSKPSDCHTAADHDLGALSGHRHGEGDFDHDHDEDFLPADATTLESVGFISMGVDIGSSSTQVAFSRLSMRGADDRHAGLGRPRRRETLYLSPIAPTAFDGSGGLDENRTRRVLDSAFRAANLTPDDIETGVVILTGEAASKRNAEAMAHLLAETAGECVCAAAGHHMEAMLSAYGSGAVEASRLRGGRRLLVIDVGGATTKFAVVEAGRVLATSAIGVGGRLVAIDRDNRITRLDPGGAVAARRAGVAWRLGDRIDPAARTTVAETLADMVFAVLRSPASADAALLTAPLGDLGALDGVMFAGGVAEYVYGREARDFGDLGPALGRAIRRRVDEAAPGLALEPPGECIRATVLGASEHALQISGETIFISSHAALLPRRNLPVLRPDLDLAGEVDAAAVAAAIGRHRRAFDRLDPNEPFVLSLPWRGAPAYARVRALAEGVEQSMADQIARRTPLYVVIEGDLALTFGAILKTDLAIASEVLALDGLVTRDFDYMDIGRMRLPSHTTPVTIKSLLFGAPPG